MRTAMREVFKEAPTPSYVVDELRLKYNLEILEKVKKDTGAKILLAQKAFSMFHFYNFLSKDYAACLCIRCSKIWLFARFALSLQAEISKKEISWQQRLHYLSPIV